MEHTKNLDILLADDDAEDRMLLVSALKEARLKNTIQEVSNGEELMDYLRNEGKYSNRETYPLPGIILLDLNMPKKDGREALHEIKLDERLKGIPVIVMTTSKVEEDILKSYDLGVNSFITKPVNFKDMVDTVKTLSHYWFEIVRLGPSGDPK